MLDTQDFYLNLSLNKKKFVANSKFYFRIADDFAPRSYQEKTCPRWTSVIDIVLDVNRIPVPAQLAIAHDYDTGYKSATIRYCFNGADALLTVIDLKVLDEQKDFETLCLQI